MVDFWKGLFGDLLLFWGTLKFGLGIVNIPNAFFKIWLAERAGASAV